MVETSSRLDIVGNVRAQRLPFRSNPIDDGAFHPLGVISSGTIGTLLNLKFDTQQLVQRLW